MRDCGPQVLDFVLKESSKSPEGGIAKRKKVHNGYDLLMQSNKFLTKLGKKIQQNFSGELKSSVKLFTRDKQTSKDVYRLTVLFRQSGLSKGDRLKVQGSAHIITGIAKKVMLKDESTGEKKQLTFEELRKLKARKL